MNLDSSLPVLCILIHLRRHTAFLPALLLSSYSDFCFFAVNIEIIGLLRLFFSPKSVVTVLYFAKLRFTPFNCVCVCVCACVCFPVFHMCVCVCVYLGISDMWQVSTSI